MATNSVTAIEQAELQAEQTVTDANAEKIQTLKSAQEKATKLSVAALEQAEQQAADILSKAQTQSNAEQTKAHQRLHEELEQLKSTGLQRQSEAIDTILKLIPTLL